MKAVIQRVRHAKVEVDSKVVGKIGIGILVFVGVGKEDTPKDAEYLAGRIVQLRIFEDALGKMNRSCLDVQGEILVVSQVTLYGNCVQGRRPSFDGAADPQKGEELYNDFVKRLRTYDLKVETGRFRAMMDVSLTNDGPVTFILNSR
ncbi:MAG: D-tyrosyl-tRNA(Tyr) deacylase [Omnitrophica WOR_2 bacterium RIFCSPLOWO2_12_FULL_50_9]|nr:MAG: D-tyrosyl-tRNA(Tyr) deacylase [Omnitrophica WOR_2 bacterium RIFCSPHIGHO2_02_FULL_50_17]OGX40705.1 MAG: D-tyrosyl-tRNA(Tyr) deacylase [Omnitrophica WOR_2 bacterium RIFCSPLOWO2_12_FULL_50_9]